MRTGLREWRRETLNVGMQVGILSQQGFILAGQRSAEYHVLVCKHVLELYTTVSLSHYCKRWELITAVLPFSH